MRGPVDVACQNTGRNLRGLVDIVWGPVDFAWGPMDIARGPVDMVPYPLDPTQYPLDPAPNLGPCSAFASSLSSMWLF